MSVPRGAVHAKWIVGKVIGTKMQKTAKVRVTRLVLDPYLLKFFNKRKTYFAHDPLQQCVVGDIVLLKALPERRSKHVKHELAEIVFKGTGLLGPQRPRGQLVKIPLRAQSGSQERRPLQPPGQTRDQQPVQAPVSQCQT
uniref:Small ribosomal subunit protein uS17m n=1 Tax=Cyanistes caeruleus TaxID=156563 RepID=A0A8C0ZA01_CYACU